MPIWLNAKINMISHHVPIIVLSADIGDAKVIMTYEPNYYNLGPKKCASH